MEMYLDDLIAYKSLYLLMQKKTSRNLEGELDELREAVEERCKKYAGYPMIQTQEKVEETSLATITEEIKIIKKIKSMLGHVRMFLNRNKNQIQEEIQPQETQQEAMAKLLLERYEKVIFAPTQIKEILGRDVVMKVLGMDLNEFMNENSKNNTRGKKLRETKPAIEH